MIQLFSRHLLVTDRSGECRSFDSDGFYSDLTACFRRCGIQDTWVPETVTMTVEEQMLQRHSASDQPLDEEDVDLLVASVLMASGYADVAAEYRRLRGVDPLSELSRGLQEWDKDRLEMILSRSLALSPARVAEVVERVSNAFHTLSFSRVSDDFIVHMGIHLLCSDEDASELPQGPWLIGPDMWQLFVSPEVRHLAEMRIFRFWPVSKVLPRVRASLHLPALARQAGDFPLTEMGFLTELVRVGRSLASALNGLREQVCSRRTHADQYPPRVIVEGGGDVIQTCFVPMSPRSALAFREEIRDVLERILGETVTRDILLTEQ